ncbi:MAG: S4 domain-containing protein, partial [Shewanella sp.]
MPFEWVGFIIRQFSLLKLSINVRLDKFICESTPLTRSLAKKALHRGDITCDGTVIKDSGFKVTEGMC